MYLKKVFQLILGIIIIVIIAEFLLSSTLKLQGSAHIPDSDVGNIIRPNLNKTEISLLDPVYVTSNSFGYNDVEHTLMKPNNTYRIVFLGDSFLESSRFPIAQNFCKITEKNLNKISNKTIETICIGISGDNTVQEYSRLEHTGLAFNPNLVVLVYQDSDFIENDISIVKNDYRPYAVLVNKSLILKNENKQKYYFDVIQKKPFEYSQVLTLIYRLHYFITENYIQERDAWIKPSLPEYYELNPTKNYTQSWEITHQMIKKINTELKMKNISLLVMTTTNAKSLFVDNFKNYTYQNKSYRFDSIYLKVKEICNEENISFYSPLEDFRKYSALMHTNLSLTTDDHWNEIGHQLAGELIAQKIIQYRLLH